MSKILIKVFLLLLLISISVFSSSYLLPYPHNDETYLIRTWQHYQYFDLDQGRPLLWYTFNVCAQLYNSIGMTSFAIIRIVAVCLLPVFGLLLFIWLRRWEKNNYAAICFVIAAMTLPASQVIIGGGGSWLVIPLILVCIAANLFFIKSKTKINLLATTVLAMTLVILSLAFYQAFTLIIFSLLMIPLIYADDHRLLLNRNDYLPTLRAGILTIISIAIYFVIWLGLAKLFIPGKSNSGYLPWNVFGTTLSNIILFFNEQLPQISLLWVINGTKEWALYLFIFVLIAGLILESMRFYLLNSSIHSLKIPVIRFLTLVSLLICSDIFIFIADNGHFYRYTTSTALALSIMLIYWKLLLEMMRLASRTNYITLFDKLWKIALITMALSASVSASIYTYRYLSIPLANEFNYTTEIIAKAKKQLNDVGNIKVILRSPCHLLPAPLEFSWQYNTCSVTYTAYLIRLALLDLMMDERRKIIIISNPGPKEEVTNFDILAAYGYPSGSINATGKTVVIDYRIPGESLFSRGLK